MFLLCLHLEISSVLLFNNNFGSDLLINNLPCDTNHIYIRPTFVPRSICSNTWSQIKTVFIAQVPKVLQQLSVDWMTFMSKGHSVVYISGFEATICFVNNTCLNLPFKGQLSLFLQLHKRVFLLCFI